MNWFKTCYNISTYLSIVIHLHEVCHKVADTCNSFGVYNILSYTYSINIISTRCHSKRRATLTFTGLGTSDLNTEQTRCCCTEVTLIWSRNFQIYLSKVCFKCYFLICNGVNERIFSMFYKRKLSITEMGIGYLQWAAWRFFFLSLSSLWWHPVLMRLTSHFTLT
jgi:hypothetical protein